MNKKRELIFVGFLLAIVMISGVYAVCCEKVEGGARCQNVIDESLCDQTNGLITSETSCKKTSYCSVGTCINSEEGSCLETTQSICNEEGGFWDERESSEVPQCQVGCCLIGEEASFITQARCNKLATDYGAEIQFKRNVPNEQQCIAMSDPYAKGACIIETESGRACTIETQQDCIDAGSEFHKGLLCTAPELNTLCSPDLGDTKCVDGKEEVYFKDTCGNTANIYDSRRTPEKDLNYWTEIKKWHQTCGIGQDNTNSPSCGNCDYSAGSACGPYNKNEDGASSNPDIGENICKDLGCTLDGERLEHREKKCLYTLGFEDNLPGSGSAVAICYDGEITIENCAAFRNEVCVESVKSTLKGSEIIETSTDSCQHNKWRGCYSQTNKEDCEDEYERDCQWFEGTNIRKSWEKIYEVEQEDDGVCFPKYSPGFDFWSEGEDTGNLCNYASDQCTITYERNLIAGGLFDTKWNIKKNGRCEPGGDWEEERQQLCLAVGDCGVKTNYISTYGNTFWGELFSGKTEDGTYNKAHFGETARSRNANPPDDGRDEELEDLYDQQSDSDEGYGP